MGPMYMGMWGMWIFPVLILIVLLIIVSKVLGQSDLNLRVKDSDKDHQKPETALEILKKRYARGEITREELDQIKNVIK